MKTYNFTNEVILEAKGISLARNFFNQECRMNMSCKMVLMLSKKSVELLRKSGHYQIAYGFEEESLEIARLRLEKEVCNESPTK